MKSLENCTFSRLFGFYTEGCFLCVNKMCIDFCYQKHNVIFTVVNSNIHFEGKIRFIFDLLLLSLQPLSFRKIAIFAKKDIR